MYLSHKKVILQKKKDKSKRRKATAKTSGKKGRNPDKEPLYRTKIPVQSANKLFKVVGIELRTKFWSIRRSNKSSGILTRIFKQRALLPKKLEGKRIFYYH